ncbi:MAG: KTSC domain-containing protein [Flavobacteriales bacterium]|nr:KTSC domain-containing protein [Flavobacteriales bacterium]MBP9081043.1 KTSC domain-containing protein [Flavobacteriales bacterium]
MKKITDSRKLIGATGTTSLKELNTLYKGLMKSHHPDRFPDDEQKRHEAEEFSKHLIDAYKFLESIHPETHVKDSAEFEQTVASNISNWHYKSLTLHITFGDGSNYEFYGVPQKVYNKFVGTDGNTRFARRHIFTVYTYRKAGGAAH